MANEIKLTIRMSITNGDYKNDINPGQKQIDQSAQGASSGIVNVGTSEENLVFTDITTEGYLYLQNLDDTNYVTYGPDATGMVAFGRLNPGEVAVMRVEPSITIVAQANTAAVNVMYLMLED